MNGVIIIDKPKGKTSHDIVGILRKKFGTRRVGHTGTLDPLATGVLPVCIGNATRAADMLIESDKKYRATFLLGKRSDTLDIEGQITEENEVSVSEEDVRRVVSEFIGEQDQIPPMYSAIKKDGKKLYDLAREGIEIEREPRRINIYSIDICDIALPAVTIDVHCSKGTYIRSLCDDIGTKLGCGAVMTELRRTYTAGFAIEDAYTIDELDKLEDLSGTLKTTDSLFLSLPEIQLNEKQEKSITNGVRMTWRNGKEGETYRVYAPDGRFLCISRLEDMRLVLVKSFWT
ncbi:MAG: tRNA pseudouridine(55) synthase TruB [Clostridia bacterium]|nr:tRNA pseudouridine(55) synthase TruB [Clostridia bacterium]MEE0411114.1 tRNA pseudouridine(55) synthase TruB [Clostridia bacterium]